MRVGYFDCFSGAAGDMILASLIHAGWPVQKLREVVSRLKIPGVDLAVDRVERGGIAATHVRVLIDIQAQPAHRHLRDIHRILDAADLSEVVRERARRVFARLAAAEAAVHGTETDHVHFHEVGASDAIVDIVGACAGVEALDLRALHASPIPTGSGTVSGAHGVMPVPAPATAELLKGLPLIPCDEPGELVTPTGAALLAELCSQFGPPPAMRLDAVGYGAGSRPGKTRPNYLRLMVGESAEVDTTTETLSVLEAQVDDLPGQNVAHACERLLEAGALDVHLVPIIMKKGRPGQVITALCAPDDESRLEAVLFAETSTLGVRRHRVSRTRLERKLVSVPTRFGEIRVKLGLRGEDVTQAWPEFEDCAAAARRANAPLRAVQQEALRAWNESR